MTPVATALGFDVGAKRIGVAVGNGFSGTARDVAVVDMRDEIADWTAIDRLMREWRPEALVVGDPRTPGEDGRESTLTQPSRQRAQRFARDAATRYPLPVWLVDERMSSIDAAARFAQGRAAGARKRSAARNLDALAAAIILERWLGAPDDADRVTAVESPSADPAVPQSRRSPTGRNVMTDTALPDTAQSDAQLRADGTLRHLLTLEGLPRAALERVLDAAQNLRADALSGTALRERLAGRTVCNLFLEASTRTRSAFHFAATRLGADVLSFDLSASSAGKGETTLDTLRNLEAMGVDCFVVRAGENGAVAALAAQAGPATALINAGDGRHQHPTQGLLDMLTLRQAKGRDFSRLTVLIVGDVRHSRVARSDLAVLRTLGCGEIRVCAPQSLLPYAYELEGCVVSHDFDAMVDGVDAFMMLRLQRERMEEGLVPSMQAYFREYGLDAARLARAKPDAVVLHPGPMNRGVEISDEVADGSQSLILAQVSNGVAVRMAVMLELMRA